MSIERQAGTGDIQERRQAIRSKEWRRRKKILFVFIIVAVRIFVQFKSSGGIGKEGERWEEGKKGSITRK